MNQIILTPVLTEPGVEDTSPWSKINPTICNEERTLTEEKTARGSTESASASCEPPCYQYTGIEPKNAFGMPMLENETGPCEGDLSEIKRKIPKRQTA